MLTPDPRKRPDIHKILCILENWDEIDAIPLNDDAFKVKSKQEAISEIKLSRYTEMQTDSLDGKDPFALKVSDLSSSQEKPKDKKHPVEEQRKEDLKVPPPDTIGWANFEDQDFPNKAPSFEVDFKFENSDKKAQNNNDTFGDKSKEKVNEHKKESTIPKEKSTKEEVKEDPARQFFDFGT